MRRACLLSALALLGAGPAPALTIDDTGAPGALGANGESAVAAAVSVDAVNVAMATGGEGGASPSHGIAPGDGGSAEATAESAVAGSAQATATALGGTGGTPSTGATGGSGGDAAASTLGDSGSGGVTVRSHASAGAGLEGGAGGMGSASADGRNLGSAHVDVVAEAVGGDGGDLSEATNAPHGGDGGQALLGTVYGSSIDGSVKVSGLAVGGSGGEGHLESGRPSGDGVSVHLVDAVDGDTSGGLYLEQIAEAGRAGEQPGGTHGEASSRLDVKKAAAALLVSSLAYGGLDAESSVSAENLAGLVWVSSEAYGGAGRQADQETAERGGDARAEAVARSVGDDQAVSVVPGLGDPQQVNARAGPGAAAGPSTTNGAGGRGGDALSRSDGTALGDSTVTVEDRAVGGHGGSGYGLAGAPGIGGSASSTAAGVGQGASAVFVSASATGGRGGRFDPALYPSDTQTARSGDANATAVARGFGRADAEATALVGQFGGFSFPWPAGESGTARASATAEGSSGEARASARASGLELGYLNAQTSVPVRSLATAVARSGVGDPFLGSPLGSSDAFAIAAGRPSQSDTQTAIQGNPEIAAAFQGNAVGIVLSLGQVGFARLQEADGAATEHRVALELLPEVLEVSALQDVVVGFMNPEFLGTGFDSLRFQANLRHQTLIDVSFDEPGEALAYFDDRVFNLGNFAINIALPLRPPSFGITPLELIFDWTGSEQGSGFGVDLIVGLTPVPEPSTVLLVALGLAVLASRARRGRSSAI